MKKKILVVGQTPPPYGGQAMMIDYLVHGDFKHIEIYHVRMCFSREFNDRGRFSWYKIGHTFKVITEIWRLRYRNHIHALYYPLSSAPKVALLRDVVILGCTRFLFKDVIFHFHAAGVSEELPRYPFGLRQLCYLVLRKPAIGITSSVYNPDDAGYLKCRVKEVVPLGIPDMNRSRSRNYNMSKPGLTVMFMGLLNSTKGEGYVLDAVSLLNKTGRDVRFLIAGKFETEDYRESFWKRVRAYGLEEKVEYRGVVTGHDKKQMFLEADVFCFPSFFSSESFGIVLLEAMMYQMPVVASKWRGIQSIVDNGNGFLVDIKDAGQIANCLTTLCDDRALLKRMGERSRTLFEDKYELSRYLEELERVMKSN